MAYRSPNGVMARSRFLVKISPAEMKFGRSEYIFDRFSSRSIATRWLLMTRTPRPRALTYIIPPGRNYMSGVSVGTIGKYVRYYTVFVLASR